MSRTEHLLKTAAERDEQHDPDRRAWTPARRIAVLLAVVYGASLLVVALHVRAYPLLSPIDELQHYDYMVKASQGQLVGRGERVGQTAMREEACRGIDAAFRPPPCETAHFDPNTFQEYGYNTASSQSPIYYAITGIVARGIVAIGVTENLLTAGRLTGGLWLGTGLLVLLAVLAELRTRRAHMVVVALLLVTAPVVLHASATVNPDASLLAVGGLVVLATLRWERRALPGWSLPLVAFFAFTVEPTTFVAVLLAVVYLGARTVQYHRPGADAQRSTGHVVGAVVALCAGVVFAFVVGMMLRRSIAVETGPIVLPRHAQFANPTFSLDEVVGEAKALVTPFNNPYLPPFLRSAYTTTLIALTGWLVIGSVVGAALYARLGSRVAALGVAAASTMVLGGPLFGLYRLPSKSFYPMPSRYGLPIVPVLLLLVAAGLKKRAALVVVAIFAAAASGYTIFQLIRA